MISKVTFIGVLISFVSFITSANASCLRLGTKPANPFIKLDNSVNLANFPVNITENQINGYSENLWRTLIWPKLETEISQTCYNWIVYESNNDGFAAVASDEIDLFLASSTITAEREEIVDFIVIIPETTGNQLIVKAEKNYSDVIASVFYTIIDKLLLAIVCILCMIIVFAFLAFVGDQVRENEKRSMFPNTINKGMAKAIGWVFAQLTGGVAQRPHTTFNHMLAAFLTILKVTLIVSIASVVAVLVTSAQTQYSIESIDDLTGQHRVVTVAGTAPYDYAVQRVREAEIIAASSISEMFDWYADESMGITAAFYDGPIITYAKFTDGRFSGSTVIPTLYDRFNLGMALPNAHGTLEEEITSIMIDIQSSGELINLWDTWFKDALDSQEEQNQNDAFTFIAMIIIVTGLGISILLYLFIKYKETERLMDWLHGIVTSYHDNIKLDNADQQDDIIEIDYNDKIVTLTKGVIIYVRTESDQDVFNWNVYGSALINTKWYRGIHKQYDRNNRNVIRYIDDERAAWHSINKADATASKVDKLQDTVDELLSIIKNRGLVDIDIKSDVNRESINKKRQSNGSTIVAYPTSGNGYNKVNVEQV